MMLLPTLLAFTAGAAASVYSPAVEARDQASIVAVLNDVNTKVGETGQLALALSAADQATFSAVEAAGAGLLSTINAGIVTVGESAELTSLEALGLIDPVNALSDSANALVDDLTQKKTEVELAASCGTFYTAFAAINAAGQNLVDAVVTKTPDSLKDTAANLAAPITEALAAVEALFADGNCVDATSSTSSDTSSVTSTATSDTATGTDIATTTDDDDDMCTSETDTATDSSTTATASATETSTVQTATETETSSAATETATETSNTATESATSTESAQTTTATTSGSTSDSATVTSSVLATAVSSTETSTTDFTTSTITTTSVYTVTSCPPTVTNCPVGHVTTDTIVIGTTVCPVTETAVSSSTAPTTAPSSSLSTTGLSSSISTTDFITSTIYTTSVYTVTSCAPTVANCPHGQVTTETIAVSTTVCPLTETEVSTKPASPTSAPPSTTSTIYSTTVYTITSCAPTVTKCPVGHVTTETIVIGTTVCPVTETEVSAKPTGASGQSSYSAASTIPVAPAQSTGGQTPSKPAGTPSLGASTGVNTLPPAGTASGSAPTGITTSTKSAETPANATTKAPATVVTAAAAGMTALAGSFGAVAIAVMAALA